MLAASATLKRWWKSMTKDTSSPKASAAFDRPLGSLGDAFAWL